MDRYKGILWLGLKISLLAIRGDFNNRWTIKSRIWLMKNKYNLFNRNLQILTVFIEQ